MFGLENGILSYVDFAESTLVLEERRVVSVVISIVVVCVVVDVVVVVVVVVEGNIGSTEKWILQIYDKRISILMVLKYDVRGVPDLQKRKVNE